MEKTICSFRMNNCERRFIHTLGMERGRLARIINELNAPTRASLCG